MSPFRGYAYQRGAGLGSIFKSLLRVVLPVAKSAGKAIGRQGLRSGIAAAGDILEGRNVGDALASHARAGAANLARKAGKSVGRPKKRGQKKKQRGAGLGRRPQGKTVLKGGICKKTASKKQKGRKKGVKTDALGTYII